QEHVQSAIPISTKINAAALPTAHGAYAGKIEDKKTEKRGRTRPRSLTELIARGFQLIKWNGYDAHPLVDIHGRIFAVLAGQPRKHEYHASVRAAYDIITAQGIAAGFPACMRKHRRGLFAAINVGLTYGKGCSFPSCIDNKHYDPIAQCLLADTDINRMANFASGVFAAWAPRLYQHYDINDRKLRQEHPELRRPFVGSIFSCPAFNFGPNVWTFKHRDITSGYVKSDLSRVSLTMGILALIGVRSMVSNQGFGCNHMSWLQPHELVATTLPYMDVSMVL
ncbi:hypothetical protein DFH08DRAFT_718672, partial [Mycena albidolilacea]